MARKLQLISELAGRTAQEVAQDVDSWKRYLDTASRLYKYKFDDQLLIYAQRPDAVACASMEVWNGKMSRWIRPGSKGIALIHESESGRPRLEYVFDVSDTRPVRGAKMPYLWEMREEHHASVLAALEARHGESSTQEIGGRLMEAAASSVNNVYQEYLQDLAYDVEGSFLEGRDAQAVGACFRDTLTASVQYALLARCGLEPSDYLDDKALGGITEFSTPAALHHLGDAASTLSKGILQEIGRAVHRHDLETVKSPQKKIEKPLEKASGIGYTKDVNKFNDLKRESKGGGINDGRTDLYEERGLPDTRPDDGRGGRSGGDAFGEIRDAAPGLPQGTPSRDIHFHAADGEADAAPVPDRSAGTGAGRPDGGRDDEEKRRGRGPERTRPDGMDPGGEQLHGTGRGDSPPGDRVPIKQGESEDNKQETAGIAPAVFASETAEAADVAPAVFMPEKQETADRRGAAVPEEKGPLKEAVSFQLSLFPTVEEQVEHIAEAQAEVRQAEKKEPPLSASQKPAGVPKSIACRILTSGGNEEGSILRIVAFFQKQPSMPDAAAFLRQEYGTGGKGVNVAGKDYAVWFQKEGIFLTPGRSINGPGCTLVPWEKAAALITQLLKDGVYAEQEKLDAARENEYGELAAKLWYLRQDFNEKAVEMGLMPGLSKLYGGFPESTGRIAALLKEKDSRDAMIGELSSFIHAYKELPGLLRFPRLHDPENLFKRLSDLELPWEQYQASRGFEAARASFITEDEINRLLTQGSNVSQGKFRIYSYFMQGHDEKECAAFLRDEYGTGGYGYYGCNEWHDSKGMTFIRGDDLSGFQGYDTVKMNWNQVQKHIRGLIGAGKYMNGKELAYIPEYEKLQLARSIYTFHYYASRTLHGGIDGWDEKAAERDFLPALDSPEESEALYKNMAETFALMSPEDGQAYQAMQEAIDGMAAYQRGEYSLFTPLPEETLRSQRMEREAAQKAEKEKISIKKPEKEPAGELEAAAQALARKQRKKELEEPDGQLAFDFTLDGMAGLETGGSKNGPAEPEMSVSEVEGPLEAAEPLKATESGQPRKVQADKKVRSEAETHPAKDTETRQSEKSFLTLYRETLAVLIDTVQKSGMGSYLRDRDLDYDSAAAELDGELDYFIAELADSQPELYAAFQSLPMFRQWMVEDVLEYTYQDISDGKDAATRHAGETGLPAWVKGDDAAPVQNAAGHGGADTPKPEQASPEKPGQKNAPLQGRLTEPENGGEEKAAPDVPKNREKQDLAPNVGEYLNLKLQYPDKLVGVQVGDHYLFYGKDAQAAARALGTKLAVQEIPGLGETAITGGRTWQAILKNLLEHGHSVVIASPEPARGENAPYQIVKERDISEYIPLGMELAIDGRRMKVDSVDYENGRVSLKDLELQGWFPVFRQEPVGFIRECVEQEMEKNSFMAGLEEKNNSGKGTDTEQAEKETADSTGLEETADSDGLKEAQRLIEDFCYNEYGGGGVDFDNPEHIEVAYTETEDGRHEIQAEVNLVDYSMYQYLDGVCVDRRSYGSIRELIDAELSGLDFDALVRLNAEAEALLEAQAEPEADSQDSMLSVEAVVTESGQAATEKTVGVYNKGLPYEIVVQEISVTPKRHNYRIADNALGTGGQKVKYQNNIAAIRTLKQIEAENRLATQEVLAKYVGWGGLAQAFDPHNEKWAGEYARLKELLTSEEYGSARSTVLNAHYTSPAVIQAIYGAVSAMDFTPGNILEPSCGIGNFFGLVPEKYGDAKLYGVELDSITGRIAKQLYQKADITVGGFEDTQHPEDFFDLAVGNVPFGEYKVHDRQYDRQNLLIHDYFLTKAIDKVRPGGIVAFITSKGTMDKADSRAREGLAQKADLLGAIRLPNNAFKANAGTSVTTDILFFQKRGSAPEKLPDWVNTGQTEEGVPLNNYFLQHPQMVLGKMAFWENMYGNKTETACLPTPGEDLSVQLSEAVKHITPPDRALLHLETPGQEEQGPGQSIPADPDVRNFSFTEKDGKLYFRENSRMTLAEPGKMQAARIRGMIGIRDSARKLIDLQLNGAGDGDIQAEQAHLNALYDDFQKKYGLLNSAGNRLAFRQDASYPLLCSLEVLDQEGNLKRKADMFTRRTIRHRQPVTSVDTAAEAFGVSIGERACVDLEYMASLMGGSGRIPQIVSDLKGIIFKDPATGPFDFSPENEDWKDGWQAADEYLSGDVRQKLEAAREAAKTYPEFAVNVEALEKVQPKDLTAPEINARIGAPWIDTEYYRQFLFEQLQTPEKLRQGKIAVMYSDVTGEWRIKGKHEDSRTNARVWNTYGTKRINAYEVFEASLNQRSVQIFDKKEVDGREVRVLNEKETAVAQQKQEALKEAFRGWIFKDPQRRADLCATYNRLFNSTRPRAYDGQHISFTGMNPEIRLEPHQRNAVARILYGKNSLLAHVVGAGKTYEMAAAAMESKRLGLCKKSMIVVPNHLTEQWGSDFLTLYPGAKVLVATKKDFEPKNRKKFCARISTGDYDAVIIGHSQFESTTCC